MAASSYLRYQWTSIWLLFGTSVGIAFVVWFSIYCHANTGLLLLWSFAYLVIGGLLGFIFSVPKIITETLPISDPASTQNLVSPAALKTRFQENTNLTQISDWLTKVIIGAGLVQLKEIPGFVHNIAKVMGRGIHNQCTPLCVDNTSTMICVAIILFFSTWGFICGYLVMKLVLTEQFILSGNGDGD